MYYVIFSVLKYPHITRDISQMKIEVIGERKIGLEPPKKGNNKKLVEFKIC